MKKNRNIQDLSTKNSFRLRFETALNEYNTEYPEWKAYVSETTRTVEQQKENVKSGASKTMDSNHLKGLAVDIFFLDMYGDYRLPTSGTIRQAFNDKMRKYGIVSGYFDLLRGFDKPHYQAVECQKPLNNKYSGGYEFALKRKDPFIKEMKKNSSKRHILINIFSRDRLHKRNNFLRELLDIK